MRGTARLLLAHLGLEELDIHLGPVDADELAAAIGKPGRGQQQEEFLEIETLDRTFHRQRSVVVGDRVEEAIAAPGSVDPHDADVVAPAERHAFGYILLIIHWRNQHSGARTRTTADFPYRSNVGILATVSGRNANEALISLP